tara:strand:- start:106 stop:348 length:243 start_codon:yes stop_codon:yes gene_type:complete
MLKVQCTVCNTIITSTGKPQVCGCSNQMVVDDTSFTAKDLANVKVLNTNVTESGHLTEDQLQWQTQRRKRKVRKLTFEER